MSKQHDTEYTLEEIARRRDDVIRRMANTPPKGAQAIGEI
jgi:hypothetical protein